MQIKKQKGFIELQGTGGVGEHVLIRFRPSHLSSLHYSNKYQNLIINIQGQLESIICTQVELEKLKRLL